MREFFTKTTNFQKIEFWAATTIFVIAIFSFITPAVQRDVNDIYTPDKHLFEEAGIRFNYYRNYFVPQLLRNVFVFILFLLLNFVLVPRLVRREAVTQTLIFLGLLFLMGGAIFGTTDTYLKNYLFQQYSSEEDTYNAIFQKSYLYFAWMLFLFGFYSVIKYTGIYMLNNQATIRARYPFVTQGGLIATIIWMVSMFLLFASRAPHQLIACALILVPFGILFYWFSLSSLIPGAFEKRKPLRNYILKCFLLLIISLVPVCLVVLLLTEDGERFAVPFTFINAFFHLLITAPLSWFVYKYQLKGNEEVRHLKKELGHSAASFDFLRSQINPHFLFNALNTIYGTALEEGAERTSEGVEKLGDMMRFMLQENMQEKIALVREIDYLENYISLQKLRTDTNPVIKIATAIERPVMPVQIAPMLLIPFVENAFKHGISLRESSHINVTLELKERTLYFDVYNSKHQRTENDPEQDKSGIGLNNVRQRLQLLYPARHELVIRETAKDFFVHLTIQLT
jgi:hypothetical protein